MLPRDLKSESGFTVVEILMVILLVGIISTVAIPQFIDFSDEASGTVTQERLVALKTAIIGDARAISSQGQYLQPGFVNHLGTLPASLNDLRVQGTYPSYDAFRKTGWRGPYISTTVPDWNLDGWKVPLQYSATTRTIRSCGPDKTCGSSDDITIQF